MQLRKFLSPEVTNVNSLFSEEDIETVRSVETIARTNSWTNEVEEKVEKIADSLDSLANGMSEVLLAEGFWSRMRASSAYVKAWEMLYPYANSDRYLSKVFVNERVRNDDAAHLRLLEASTNSEHTGICHVQNARDQRGGYSVYVPESYDPAKTYPLISTLHGGSGHGSSEYWKWLRDARCEGFVVHSPTSTDSTWQLFEPEREIETLLAQISQIKANWNVDEHRLLLTGTSDGGTFSLVAGLLEDSPFTHLAPCAASFHPILLEGTTRARLEQVKIYLIHGARDWMFPVDVAQMAHHALRTAGVNIVYREISELGHAWPDEENSAILDWYVHDN